MAKIMQINITCGRGSTGDIAARLYHACKSDGNDARFAYSSFEPSIPTAFRIENILQHYYRRGMNKYFGKRQSHSTPGTKRLIRYIQKEKPDLIHIHNVQQNSLNYILFFDFLKKVNIPVVFTLHDCWSFTGGCYHFFVKKCEKYANANCGNCNVDKDDICVSAGKAYSYKQQLIGANNHIYCVCVSKWLQTAASKSYMHTMEHKPCVIYNGVDMQVFYPRKSNMQRQWNVQDTDFVILGVASYWTYDKGLQYFEKLSECLPDNCKVVLVGYGLKEPKRRFPKLICVPPTQCREELAEIYSCADVFANLSVEETFGLTTAEALACGTPAIVFNTTACPEIIDDNTGVYIDFQNKIEEDVRLIANAIKRIKHNGKKMYSSACIKRVSEHFSTEKMTDAYLALYRSILSESKCEH